MLFYRDSFPLWQLSIVCRYHYVRFFTASLSLFKIFILGLFHSTFFTASHFHFTRFHLWFISTMHVFYVVPLSLWSLINWMPFTWHAFSSRISSTIPAFYRCFLPIFTLFKLAPSDYAGILLWLISATLFYYSMSLPLCTLFIMCSFHFERF